MLALMFIMRKFRYELWKPNLRSMMESDMKEVSVGNKSKADVLANCLQQMKACFLDVRLEFCQCLSLIKKIRSYKLSLFGKPRAANKYYTLLQCLMITHDLQSSKCSPSCTLALFFFFQNTTCISLCAYLVNLILASNQTRTNGRQGWKK